MKYLNFIIFVILLLVYLLFSSQIKFSTNFLEIFLSQKSIELFNMAKKLGFKDEILIAKKGFEKKDLDELYKIADELKQIPEITKVEIKKSTSHELKKQIKEHYLLLSNFDNKELSNKDIKKRIKKIYDDLNNPFSFSPVNSYDPLELFSIDLQNLQKFTKLKDFGYVLKAQTSIDTANASQARPLYKKLNMVLNKHSDTIAIAPFFYLVENSAHIKNDAQTIMFVSSIMLLILYFIILKNHKLFLNTIFAIGSSILSAILVTWLVYDSISILSLVFGVSITTISIDYMFHYYFHNNFSLKKPIFEKRVFLGFLTTFGVFFIFSFIDVELFSQLAVFSAISLSVAYALFSFTFVYLGIKEPKQDKTLNAKKELKPLYVILVSLVMLLYTYSNLEFDTNLKNLDYQNKKLIELTKKFNKGVEKKSFQTILISGETKEILLKQYESFLLNHPNTLGIGNFVLSKSKCQKRVKELKNFGFKNIRNTINKYAKELGFRDDTFKNAYKGTDKQKCNFKIIKDMKFKIIKDNKMFYTIALVPKSEVLKDTQYIKVVDLAKSLRSDTKNMKKTLIFYALISLIFILLIMFIVSRRKMFYPLMYILFPISTALLAITLIGKINIMHMFALVILLAISIDYGIYMYETKTLNQTRKAISYALISTFCGFGVLIFSTTAALFSIGLVISVGIGSIFLLLYVSL